MQPYQGYDDPNKRKVSVLFIRWFKRIATVCAAFGIVLFGVIMVLAKPLRAYETFVVVVLVMSPFWVVAGLKLQQLCNHHWVALDELKNKPRDERRKFIRQLLFIWGGMICMAINAVYGLNAILDTSPDELHQLTVTGKDYRTGRHGDRTYYAIVPSFTDSQLSKLGLRGDNWALDSEEHITLSKEEDDRVVAGQTQARFTIRHGFFDIPWVVKSRIDADAQPLPMATPATSPTRWDTIPLLPSTATPPTPEQLAKYNAQQKYEQGVAYAFGRGVPKNEVLAVQLFQQAADTGHAEAEHMLGYMYSNGLGGLTQDWVKANIWVRKAAEQGLAVAQDDLGVSYGDGRGVPQDWVECYMWIRMAANQRNTQAIQDLDYAKARMTPEQIAQAEQRAKEWKPVSSTSFERPY